MYDQSKRSFNFRYLKATDLPFNKRVCLPGPIDEETEVSIQSLKTRLNRGNAKICREGKEYEVE